jgi:hypothetical protein
VSIAEHPPLKDRIADFLRDIDQFLARGRPSEILDLYHLGRSALVWHYDAPTTTRDVDVLRPRGNQSLIEFVIAEFGQGTDAAHRHGLYLEIVPDVLPPIAMGFEKRATQIAGSWTNLRIFRPDPHDLAVTKMRRFAARDREDIRFLSDRGLLDAERLTDLLDKAFFWNHPKDGDPFRDTAFEHLEIVKKYLRGEIMEF